ncbi:MAG: DUF6242 domain-containing protein [Paludibacter sp.]|nr:DUF6242 domain-containing protein [Paludibacter sp.]
MKLIPFKFLLFSAILGLFTSCDWLDTNPTVVSTNPSFVSLSFGKNDSIPNINKAVFKLVWDGLLNDSIIVNLDSLPYRTRIDSVFPAFKFYSSSAAYLYLRKTTGSGVDTVLITGKDTIDFTRVLRIKNIAADTKTEKPYPIKVNVHQVESELYTWKRYVESIYTQTASTQKAVTRNDSIFFYAGSGINNYLYVNKIGQSWNESKVTGLPNYSDLNNITQFNNKFYLINDNIEIYSTSDCFNWKKENIANINFKFISFLYTLNGKLWAITKSNIDQKYRFANTVDGITWNIGNEIPVNFPVGDFAALSFYTKNEKEKAIVLGGYSAGGTLLNNVWSTENGTLWVDFTVENVTLDSLSGATIIPYDGKLLLFGGMNMSGKIVKTNYMQSIDEGLSWSIPSTTYNQLREVIVSGTSTNYLYYKPRSYQSVLNVVVKNTAKGYSDYFIYLIGGRDEKAKVYTDVWVGKLNRLSFIQK